MGDLFMSLSYTCEVNQANPLDNLIELQRHVTNSPPAPSGGRPGTTAMRSADPVGHVG